MQKKMPNANERSACVGKIATIDLNGEWWIWLVVCEFRDDDNMVCYPLKRFQWRWPFQQLNEFLIHFWFLVWYYFWKKKIKSNLKRKIANSMRKNKNDNHCERKGCLLRCANFALYCFENSNLIRQIYVFFCLNNK